MTAHSKIIYCINFANEYLVTSGLDGYIKVFSFSTLGCLKSIKFDHKQFLKFIYYNHLIILTNQ